MTNLQVIRVAIVDDDALVRSGLVAILSLEPDLDVVGEGGDGADVPALVAATRPDVVLMDVRMPRIDGIQATTRLTQTSDTRVVVLTTFEHDSAVYDALLAGARGFVLKRASTDELLSAIRLAARTDALLFPEAVRELARHHAPARPHAPRWAQSLTDRERDVLALLARGHTNAEIGAGLFISGETVKTHVSALLAKSGARDRTGLVVRAYEDGVIRPGTPD